MHKNCKFTRHLMPIETEQQFWKHILVVEVKSYEIKQNKTKQNKRNIQRL